MPNFTLKVDSLNELCTHEETHIFKNVMSLPIDHGVNEDRSEILKDNIEDSSSFRFRLRERWFLDATALSTSVKRFMLTFCRAVCLHLHPFKK